MNYWDNMNELPRNKFVMNAFSHSLRSLVCHIKGKLYLFYFLFFVFSFFWRNTKEEKNFFFIYKKIPFGFFHTEKESK